VKKNNSWRPDVIADNNLFSDSQNKIVWLGHASFLLTINGKNILFDPVFGDIPFIKRLIPFPTSTNKIKQIDYVLLSHAHFDHCDKKSMQILAKQNRQMHLLAPLKSTALIKSFDKSIKAQEAGW
jgi:L-ascorbate metabolism protein UlaG (beta-lactamase superfamily)